MFKRVGTEYEADNVGETSHVLYRKLTSLLRSMN